MAEDDRYRILPLIASATEIVCALGFRDQLVGRSHECDFPPDVQMLPAATAPRFDVNGSSRQIDERVKSLLRESLVEDTLGVSKVFPEKSRELQPTHIITQTQCDVCAVSLRDVEAAVEQVAGCKATIVSLQPNSLADVWADFMRVASALGDTQAGSQMVARLQDRMAAIESRTRPLTETPTVAGIEWVDPLMAVGNWVPELIRMAGGRNLFGKAGEHSPWMQFDEMVAADPDVIILSVCGFDIARTRQDVPILEARPEWADLKAVKSGRVFVADGNQYFNRPGPRLVESLEILAEILHPDAFDFGHFALNFGRSVPKIFGRCDGDLNCDGVVDVIDFGIFAPDYGCGTGP